MGITFGGDSGFGQTIKNINKKEQRAKSPSRGLEVIYETEPFISTKKDSMHFKFKNNKHSVDRAQFKSDFKENMLLSFYNWHKIESSAVNQPLIETNPSKMVSSSL